MSLARVTLGLLRRPSALLRAGRGLASGRTALAQEADTGPVKFTESRAYQVIPGWKANRDDKNAVSSRRPLFLLTRPVPRTLGSNSLLSPSVLALS
jgi:hypothetical protein